MKKAAFTLAASAILSSVASAALVAWYPLDEGSGTVVADASGNGNTMTAAGGGTWSGTGAFGGSYHVGPNGGVVARTGVFGSLSGINATTGNDVTIAFWAKADAESMGGSVFYISDSTSAAGNRIFQSHLEWTNGLTYFDTDWTSGTSRVSGDVGSVSDVMHHYAFTYDGDSGAMAVWKDGVPTLTGTGDVKASLPWASIQNMEFGAASFSAYWGTGGQLDDIGIWNEVLSPSAIAQIRTSGIGSTVPEPGVTALALLAGAIGVRRRRR